MKNIRVVDESTLKEIARYGTEEQIVEVLSNHLCGLNVEHEMVKRAKHLGSDKIFKALISGKRARIAIVKKVIEIKGWEFFLTNLDVFNDSVSGFHASVFSDKNYDDVVDVVERCELPVEALITVAQCYPLLSELVAKKIKAKISK